MNSSASKTSNFGKLTVVPLREGWEHEASQFTPWLAGEENLELLSEALGIELELTGQEQSVGAFSADILCKDTVTGHTVLIENQLEKTDHTHLGQIITYAAGLDARTVVWISAKLREEHRAAVDWLNENTVESLQFFGVEFELWRIGDSAPAPKFNVVSKPNDWSKAVSEVAHSLASGALSPTKQQQQRYWAALGEHLLRKSKSIRPQKALPQHWTNFSIGRSGMNIAATINTVKNRIGVELWISNGSAKEQFSSLKGKKDEIESRMQEHLEWQGLPDSKGARIVVYKTDVDPTDESGWPEQHEWLVKQIEKFNTVFRPIVRELP
jgi:hypothetical protein